MQLETLGGIRLHGADFSRPKSLLLLAYLCLEGPQSRQHLGTLFYPSSEDRADAISTALRRLREVDDIMTENGGRTGHVSVSNSVSCDAVQLLEHFKAGDLEQVTSLYTGAFLADLGEGLGVELEDWVFQTRERIAGLVRTAHLELAEQAVILRDTSHALWNAEKALQVIAAPPLSSRELRRLYSLLSAHGVGGTGATSAILEQLRVEAQSLGEVLAEDARILHQAIT